MFTSPFVAFQLGSIEKSPQDIREYWTPERKRAAAPAHKFRSSAGISGAADAVIPDATSTALVTGPNLDGDALCSG